MISVIIPLYNKKDSIIRTLTSILKQTEVDFEVVVVDDGSTDGSGELVQALENGLVCYYRKENGGVSSARNYGIKKAKGEWLIFLDADDELTEGALKFLSHLQSQYSKEKIIIGGTTRSQVSLKESYVSKATSTPFFDSWRRHFLPASGNMLIHRSLIEKYGGYDERISFYEDYEFALRMMLFGSVVYSNRPIRIYHQEEGGLSTTHHNIAKDMAYYLPEKLSSYPFCGKALWYENLEYMLFWNRKKSETANYYKQMRAKYFGHIYSILHNIRQRLTNHKWI